MEAIFSYMEDLTKDPDTTEKVRSILKENATDSSFLFNLDLNGETALHVAAYYGHTEVVKVLIDAARKLPSAPKPFWKADRSPVISFIRIANRWRNTALHLAVINHNVDVVKLLIEADEMDAHIQNNDGDSPVYLAAKRGYNDIVKLICSTCRAASLEGPDKKTALHAAVAMLHEGI